MDDLIEQADRLTLENFSNKVRFERAIFFSWGCSIGDCQFCYMSTQPKYKLPKETRRSNASILTEFILSKNLGWDIGFFTGGIGVLKPEELEFLLKAALEISGGKIWLSIGPLSKELLRRYQPYIRGIVGSTETIHPDLHQQICPSKPLAPYEKMFEEAEKLGLEKAMTFIVGLGEARDDFELLKKFITKHNVTKIHVYGLIPQKGTVFEHQNIPTAEEQAWWITQLRIAFPRLDIQCGIWEDRVERVSDLLRAGANSISKFKALKLFGSKIAENIEKEVEKAGRIFLGSLTKLPEIDWNQEVEKLYVDDDLKKEIKKKLKEYLKRM